MIFREAQGLATFNYGTCLVVSVLRVAVFRTESDPEQAQKSININKTVLGFLLLTHGEEWRGKVCLYANAGIASFC